MALPAWAGALQSAGGVLGIGSKVAGIASAFGIGGGEKRPRYRDALQAQIYATENDINTKMKMAKQHGIHPLMMLGVGSASSPTPHIASAGNMGQSIAQAGSDISRAISAGSSTNLEKLQERLLAAQIEGQEIDNVSRASQLARTNQAGSAPASSMAALKEQIANRDTPLGRKQGAFPLHKTAYDEEGNTVRMFNEEDLGDNDWAQLYHLMRYTLPDGAHNNARKLKKVLKRGFKSLGY